MARGVDADAALKLELARGEKHAEALMHIARTCDERSSEMKEQHAAALCVKDAATTKMQDENAALKAKLLQLAASHAIGKLSGSRKRRAEGAGRIDADPHPRCGHDP
jgi:hypothetical protein